MITQPEFNAYGEKIGEDGEVLYLGGSRTATRTSISEVNSNNLSGLENLFVGAYGIKYDGKTNLHYMRYRWYSADQMRFLSPDLLLGINRYAYCDGNPVNKIDPLGLKGNTWEERQKEDQEALSVFWQAYVTANSSPPSQHSLNVYNSYYYHYPPKSSADYFLDKMTQKYSNWPTIGPYGAPAGVWNYGGIGEGAWFDYLGYHTPVLFDTKNQHTFFYYEIPEIVHGKHFITGSKESNELRETWVGSYWDSLVNFQWGNDYIWWGCSDKYYQINYEMDEKRRNQLQKIIKEKKKCRKSLKNKK